MTLFIFVPMIDTENFLNTKVIDKLMGIIFYGMHFSRKCTVGEI